MILWFWPVVGKLSPMVRRVRITWALWWGWSRCSAPQQGRLGWLSPHWAGRNFQKMLQSANLNQTTAIRMASLPACVEVCDLLLATPQLTNIPPYLSSRLTSKKHFLVLFSWFPLSFPLDFPFSFLLSAHQTEDHSVVAPLPSPVPPQLGWTLSHSISGKVSFLRIKVERNIFLTLIQMHYDIYIHIFLSVVLSPRQ